jgi:hypothetical protein
VRTAVSCQQTVTPTTFLPDMYKLLTNDHQVAVWSVETTFSSMFIHHAVTDPFSRLRQCIGDNQPTGET